MNILQLALVQFDIHWENPEKNFELLDELLENVKSDIFFLPEMFSTAFTMNPKKMAEPFCGKSFQYLQSKAIEKNAVFVASIPTQVGSKYFNKLYWVEPNETFSYYDKRHLFSMVEEGKYYTPGDERKIIQYKDWKLMPQVCFDLRFPVWSRNDFGYDILFYVANWPEKRIDAWNTLLKARAIENQAYVVGVNRIGLDANGINHSGDSMVYNALGEKMSCKNQNGILIFEVEKSHLQKIRTQFNFLQEQDLFQIKQK